MTHETDGDRRARLAEIRAATPSDDRAIWQERQFLLAELERVERLCVAHRNAAGIAGQERDAARAELKQWVDRFGGWSSIPDAAAALEWKRLYDAAQARIVELEKVATHPDCWGGGAAFQRDRAAALRAPEPDKGGAE